MSALADSSRRGAVDLGVAATMVGLTFCWGLNQVAIKFATTGFSPFFMLFARSAIGGVTVFLWCVVRGIPIFGKDGTLVAGSLVGLAFWAEFVLLFIGLDLTSAARGALMLCTMPFWVLIGGHFLLGERMWLRHVVGLAMAFAGVVLVFSDRLSAAGGAHALLGDMLCLAAGAAWGANTLMVKRPKLASVSAERILLYQLVVSALLALPILPFAGPLLRDVGVPTVAALLFQSVFVVGFTYLMWFWLMRRYSAAGLASFTFLTPVFAVLCGAALLGEPLTGRIFAALALIAAGLVVVNRPAARR